MDDENTNKAPNKLVEIFLIFLKLGLSSFGGPIAHIGYFRKEFIDKRNWLNDQQFGQLLAICQFLPGPASSQMGFCLGLLRAGWLGALLAFLAFTLPSALMLIACASILTYFNGPFGAASLSGLKLVACAVVADAVFSMAKTLCPDTKTRSIAILVLVSLLTVPFTGMQLYMVALSAIVGMILLRNQKMANHQDQSIAISYSPIFGILFIILFFLFLLFLPLFASEQLHILSVANAFYQAGALVFGGGHVVLPLLQDSMVGNNWISQESFLAGYGASQTIPGPMFTFSAYLGSLMSENNSIVMAMIALMFMFLPGFLLVAGVLPFWKKLAGNTNAIRAITGINAGVVGLLAAALYDPIITTGINTVSGAIIAISAFILLIVGRVSSLIVIIWCLLASLVNAYLF